MSGRSPLTARRDQHAGNQQPVDLVGAFEDAVDARIAVIPLGGVVLDEAVAAMNLHVLVEHEVECLAADDLRDGRLDGELLEGARAARRRRAQLPASAASISPAVR